MNRSQFTWKTCASFHVPLGCQPDAIVKYVFDIDLGGCGRAVSDEFEQTFDILKAPLRANTRSSCFLEV